jgi:hypothetical protein
MIAQLRLFLRLARALSRLNIHGVQLIAEFAESASVVGDLRRGETFGGAR